MKRFFLLIISVICSLSLLAQNGLLDSRLRSNLYLNVYTNKSSCTVGEPIVVTYKLYSSLESVSEIVKDPAFHGFEFNDLISAGDQVVSRETIDGVRFDVHTIRKVQLTPVESGKLELDPMVVSNRVKLIDNAGNKSPLLNGVDDQSITNGEVRLTISSVPISISVSDVPANSRPPVYNGAVGDFKMNVHLSKVNFVPGEQGALQITISGVGDFNKITQPVIEWPRDVVIEPVRVQDQYNRSSKNTPGSKIFTIPFTAGKTGSFTIMPIQFSYFDSKNNRYNTINNPPITFYYREDANRTRSQSNLNTGENNNLGALLIGIGVIAILLLILLLVKRAKKKKEKTIAPVIAPRQNSTKFTHHPVVNIDSILQPAETTISANGSSFYNALKQGMVRFFEEKFAIPASLFNKATLKNTMTERNIDESRQNEVFNLLTEIEMNIYSAGGMDGDRARLLQKTKNILKAL